MDSRKHSHTHRTADYIPLLLSIFCIGTSGPMGRLIQMPAAAVICIRSVIALFLLAIILSFSKQSFRISDRKLRNYVLLSGFFLAIHWITYFTALQLSSVALGMLSMFTYPIITVLLEPLYIRTPFRPIHLLIALLAFAGIYILLPDLDLKNEKTTGILVGLLSAFLYSWRNLIVKKHVIRLNGLVVVSWQLLVVIGITLPFFLFVPDQSENIQSYAVPLLFLGVVTTAMGHSFFVKSLQFFSATTVSILSNFTPVIGIVAGIFLLHEKPSKNILIGGGLILVSALIEVGLTRYRSPAKPEAP